MSPASTKHTSQVEEDASEVSSSALDDDSGEEEEQEISKKRKLSDKDVPVLSHAERRRQKRRERRREEQTDDNVLLPSKRVRQGKSRNDISDATTKRQNSVWVGNLAFKTTVEDLKSFFAGAGEITRVNMPTKVAPAPARKTENRGFAYVDFSTPEGKLAAIALSEQPLTGRKLLIKDGDDFTSRPKPAESDESGVAMSRKTTTLSKTAQKIIKSQKQPPGPTLFLGNLGFETTEGNIKEMLDAHHRNPSTGKKHRNSDSGAESKDVPSTSAPPTGWIRRVRMGTFEDSGLCKGFAFVDFVSTENATSALVNPKNYFLNGRKLVIEYASPDAVRRGMPTRQQVNKDDKSREQRGKNPAPRAIQHDNIGQQDTEEHRPPKRQRVEKAEKSRANTRDTRTRQGPKYRAKPGAALASAQRESVAIIPSQGKKIKFD